MKNEIEQFLSSCIRHKYGHTETLLKNQNKQTNKQNKTNNQALLQNKTEPCKPITNFHRQTEQWRRRRGSDLKYIFLAPPSPTQLASQNNSQMF